MLIVKVAFPVAALLLASLASEARYHSRLSRVPRPRERREKHRYFEQCHFVDAWKERLGHVSVLAFLDPAWQYSFRQAVMLELLSSRLRKSGFPDIRFFAISPFSDLTKNERSQDEIEIEAWQEFGANEMESLVDGDFLSGNGSKITLVRDDPRSRLWERFRALRDQVIIIDRCGKLTYQVMVPWSILLFPYVKAAILSTYEDDPCGGCDPTIYRVSSHEDHVVRLKSTDKEETSLQREVDTNVDSIWTTERLENATVHHDKSPSEKERKVSTASNTFIHPEGLTNDTDHPNLSESSTELSTEFTNDTERPNLSTESSTEPTTYRYDSTKESRFDEDHPESMRDQGDPTNSRDDGTIPDATASTFELQRNVFSSEQAGSHSSANNNSLISVNYTTDHTLLLDEPAVGETESDSTPADEETTTTMDFADKTQDRNTTLKNAERYGEDALPLRIIIYAPHIHKSGKKTKKYTHLLLRTDDPDFHGHLDSGVDDASPTDSWQDVDSRTSSKEYDWETTEADEQNANQKYTYDVDESPGLYGEVADYWKSYDNDITDSNETYIDDTYNNSTTSYNEEHHTNVSDHALISKPEESDSIVIKDPNVESSTDPQNIVGSNTIKSSKPNNTNDQVDTEEEKRYKLNKHYNKLLSWINYILNK